MDDRGGAVATRFVAPAIVVATVVAGLVGLFPPVGLEAPPANDLVLHETLAAYVAEHYFEHWPVDPWFPSIGTGFPVFAHYPHLSHLVAATVAQVVPMSPRTTYAALAWLLMAALPAIVAVSIRRLGGSPWAAAIGAVLIVVTMTDPELGIGWESYSFRGSGMVPQLWGVAFLFPALAWGWTALRDRGRLVAGVLIGCVIVAHSVVGYVAAGSVALAAIVPWCPRPVVARLGRLATVGIAALLASAYYVVPFVLRLGEVLQSQWEPAWKYDSIGFAGVAAMIASGGAFDGGRLPILSVVVLGALVGCAVVALRTRDALRLWLVLGALVWLALWCGRAGWGSSIDLLPFASGLPMRRLIVGFQAFALLAAAFTLDDLRRWAVARRGSAGGAAFLVLAILVFAVPVARRADRTLDEARVAAARVAAVERTPALAGTIHLLREQPPGRVFAGWYRDWGERFAIEGVPVYTHLQSAGFDMIALPFIAMSIPVEWQIRADTDRLPACDLYNIRYWVAPRGIPGPRFGTLLATVGDIAVYTVPSSGYFGLGRAASRGDTPRRGQAAWAEVYEAGRRWLETITIDDREYLAMEPGVSPIDGPAEGSLADERVGPGSFAVRADVPRTTDLVLKVTYHPNWHVTVDGLPSSFVRVFPGFMAVRLPAGVHEVAFAYRSPAWGKALFVVSLAWVVAVVGRAVGGRRRARPTTP